MVQFSTHLNTQTNLETSINSKNSTHLTTQPRVGDLAISFKKTWLAVGLLPICGLYGCGTLSSSGASSELVFPENAAQVRPAEAVHDRDVIERVAVNPFDPIALNNLAVAEAARGRYQQALMLLQRAVKLAPARPDIAANFNSLQRWLALAEGQAAIGVQPQPLALPYQDSLAPDVPPLWQKPPAMAAQPQRPVPVFGAPSQGLTGTLSTPPVTPAPLPPVVANPPANSNKATPASAPATTKKPIKPKQKGN
jgi:hypothetical protein